MDDRRVTGGNRTEDTIFALSSGSLPAGVAVVRLSGAQTACVVASLFGRMPEPRVATYGPIRSAAGELIDRGLVLWFPGAANFTGEDSAEFHLHGGPAVVRALVAALQSFDAVRPADAGEFSRRAFLNDKLDLTAVEGLADLIAAETEAQRRLALRQAGGSIRTVLEAWRGRLIRQRALIEAELDFPDEDDVPGSVSDIVWREAAELATEIRAHLTWGDRGERVRSGLEVVLMGPPNAGKSSLLNTLARREAAIVTPEAGTTRDIIEVRMDLGGYAVTLVDTAGLRDATGLVEREGIRRARARGAAADLVLWLVAPGGDADPPELAAACEVWRIGTKADVAAGSPDLRHQVSAVSGVGIAELEAAIEAFAAANLGGAEELVITRARHRTGIVDCLFHLDRALAADHLGLELRAEDLRAAADAIGRVTGRVDVEDLLDVIFRDFCIGK